MTLKANIGSEAGFIPFPASIDSPLFTERQYEILLLLVDGHTQESISHQLGIGIDTIKTQLGRIQDKLCLSSRSSIELVAWYYKTFWEPKKDVSLRSFCQDGRVLYYRRGAKSATKK